MAGDGSCCISQFASGVSAIVIGKPSSDYFKRALSDLGVVPEEVQEYFSYLSSDHTRLLSVLFLLLRL